MQEHELLQLHYGAGSYLEVILTGRGVEPTVECIPAAGLLDYGHVVAGDTATQSLQVHYSYVDDLYSHVAITVVIIVPWMYSCRINLR